MIIKAASERMRRDFEERRVLNTELANLVAFAFHSPGKIPAYKPMGGVQHEESNEADDAYVRAFFIGMASASKSE